jgi:osmotically-inducible protein OsmY
MRKTVALIIVLALVGGGGYLAYSRDWGPAKWIKQKLGLSGDSKTTANVKSALGLSKRLSPFKIEVQTQEGVVTLQGKVPSEDAKSLAAEIARDTAGVKDVKNEIAVDLSAQPAGESAWVNDLQIKAEILQALARSPELGGQAIEVRVENHVASLSGSVDTRAQRNGAEQLARATDGVTGVTNDLTVKYPEAANEARSAAAPVDPNSDLAKRVKFELYETGGFDTMTLDVKAKDGVVTLTGKVRTRAEQLLATYVAQGTPGVKKAVNQLEVGPPPSK